MIALTNHIGVIVNKASFLFVGVCFDMTDTYKPADEQTKQYGALLEDVPGLETMKDNWYACQCFLVKIEGNYMNGFITDEQSKMLRDRVLPLCKKK